jgi:hypothetical protein
MSLEGERLMGASMSGKYLDYLSSADLYSWRFQVRNNFFFSFAVTFPNTSASPIRLLPLILFLIAFF